MQVNETCLKANKKLAVLRNVKLLSRQTPDLLYKLTVRSVVDYALPVYYKCLKVTDLARLENLQYKAAKIVTGAYHFTSKEKLNLELGWETIKARGDLLSLNFFQKIHLQLTRPLIRTCMPKLDFEKTCNTRSKGGYIPFKYKCEKFNNSFSQILSKFGMTYPGIYKLKILKSLKSAPKKNLNLPDINISQEDLSLATSC